MSAWWWGAFMFVIGAVGGYAGGRVAGMKHVMEGPYAAAVARNEACIQEQIRMVRAALQQENEDKRRHLLSVLASGNVAQLLAELVQ